MGSSSSKQDIMKRLEELDQKELQMNLQLKKMQTKLNSMLPKNEQIKINKDLTPDSKVIRAYDVIELGKGRNYSKTLGKSKKSSKNVSKFKKNNDEEID